MSTEVVVDGIIASSLRISGFHASFSYLGNGGRKSMSNDLQEENIRYIFGRRCCALADVDQCKCPVLKRTRAPSFDSISPTPKGRQHKRAVSEVEVVFY